MRFKTIDDFDVRGKVVLVRSDLNSEIVKGKPVMNERISESAKTINELRRKGARVVVMAHQGRPGEKDFTSLKGHAKLLKIKFVDDVIGKKAVGEIARLKNGEALLLENVRVLKEEVADGRDNAMVKVLGNVCDIYLNDSFSVSHREQTSIVGFPRVLPSGIGRLMQKELEGLEKIRKMKNVLYVLGGSKEDNLLLMKHSKVITCGIWGQLCLIAKGENLGASEKLLGDKLKAIPSLRKVILGKRTPMDLAVKIKGRRRELDLSEFPSKYEVFDIGSKTIKLYKELISRADAVFMKGTAGYCEDRKFCKGTFELLKAVSRARFSVLAGGSLSTALSRSGIGRGKFGHVSLAGGALVHFLAGKKLAGLEALKKR